MNIIRLLKSKGKWGKLKKRIQLSQVKSLPRFKEGTISILGKPLRYVDSASFAFMYEEIFRQGIYEFESKKDNPLIVDAGANIGLSIIYFKRLFPAAKIIAFEPDSHIFSVLKDNVSAYQLDNTVLINKALWKEETTLSFHSEGADAGRLDKNREGSKNELVETDLLSKYLNQQVDMLKIDIEGAELEVLLECKNELRNIKNIFIEYHSFKDSPQQLGHLLDILKQNGFRYQIQNTAFISKQAFVKRREDYGMDMQLNIYGFKE